MRKTLLDAATATSTGAADYNIDRRPARSYQASIAGTGAVTATVIIEGSNEEVPVNYLTLGTITLSGTTSASDGFVGTAAWASVRARLAAISGTNATVTVTMGA